jgi:UDP-N-acetylmuramate dehydrogenase
MTAAVRFEPSVSLAPLTSWRIGGPAAWLAEPADAADLAECLAFAEARGLPVLALGGGSTVLVADSGYPGLILRCGRRDCRLEPAGAELAQVTVGARATLAAVARELARAGWGGLEWAEGIPGTVGGAVVGNAGAYGGTIAEFCRSVTIWSREEGTRRLPSRDMAFSYRRSRLTGQDSTATFLLEAEFELRRDDRARLLERIKEIGAQRRARSPVGLSCGSVFRNPPGDSAGRLIEACGLRGATVGGAMISERHANYILNRGGATARDVLTLVDRAREEVRRASGIELELEVRLVGFGAAG